MGTTGDGINANKSSWSFSGDTVSSFDNHVKKSVPFYDNGQKLICEISDYFLKNENAICYDLGSSTGSLTFNLAEYNKNIRPKVKFHGVDIEKDMVNFAKKKIKKNKLSNILFSCEDLSKFKFTKTPFITSYYTIQFIKPSERQKIINKIYDSLEWGGGFVMFEKVRAPDARFQDMMLGLYDEYKINAGYSSDEIFNKTRSLRGVLEPFSSQGNKDLLVRSGFKDILTVMKYLCFEGFLAIK